MWATAPLTVPPPKDNKKIELRPETRLQVNGDYRYRQEDEDAFVIYNVEDDIYFMVNKAYCDFIANFRDDETFTFDELAKKYDTATDNQSFYDVILFLVQKNILKIV